MDGGAPRVSADASVFLSPAIDHYMRVTTRCPNAPSSDVSQRSGSPESEATMARGQVRPLLLFYFQMVNRAYSSVFVSHATQEAAKQATDLRREWRTD